ncbi:hypothetical protein BOX15_Mlig004270g1 [Macrostomum lignano]|uniref:Transcription factor CBF/NF-Y/archaeal histone domain-containing protein n=1 Tax=Macrostomum lignano TaxID=282301 RepID=A0A267GXT8_9PLAT|nr:hypothetical protein BOX15_Mlig004270g1 [Macrostomum lignano]
MPLKRGKFSARFPAGRIKKIMQLDKEVGKVSATVPPVVSRALELFVENLISESFQLAQRNNLTKTISVSHLKHVIEREEKFSFARKLVRNVQELQIKALSDTLPNDSTTAAGSASSSSAIFAASVGGASSSSTAPKKRGRKPKRLLKAADSATTAATTSATAEPRQKRKYTRRAPTAAQLAAAAAASAVEEPEPVMKSAKAEISGKPIETVDTEEDDNDGEEEDIEDENDDDNNDDEDDDEAAEAAAAAAVVSADVYPVGQAQHLLDNDQDAEYDD